MELVPFLNKLKKLRVDRSKGSAAPHKAILLLSILDLIRNNQLTDNRIFISPELVAKFKDNWHSFVLSDKFLPNFSLPFYHLKSDSFWHLKTLPGRELLLTSSGSIKSFSGLKNAVAYGYFEESIFLLLLNETNRELIRRVLLKTFLNTDELPYVHKQFDFYHEVEYQILNEPTSAYQKKIEHSDEEDVFVRGGVFKKVIPKIYNYTCCISKMKITASRDVQMIDACHIIPFADSHDDTITNGISLSPNLHRAYDRFLITINEKFDVIVSEHFIESGPHSLRQFHQKKIFLPDDKRYYPSPSNLNWHFEKFKQIHQ